MGRVLGVDLGSTRVGLAVSDPEGLTAQPLEVHKRRDGEDLVAVVARRASELEVGEIVVGIPLRMDGAHGPEADAAESFALRLEKATSLPVRRWDERLSTVEASRAMRSAGADARRQRGVIDKVAAALVLGAYLESRRPRT
jgi:putative Holliday junction resolvase